MIRQVKRNVLKSQYYRLKCDEKIFYVRWKQNSHLEQLNNCAFNLFLVIYLKQWLAMMTTLKMFPPFFNFRNIDDCIFLSK